jgi:PAS domain S-box-containing protein
MKKILIICLLLLLFSAFGIYSAAAADSPETVKVGVYEDQVDAFSQSSSNRLPTQPVVTDTFSNWAKWTLIGIILVGLFLIGSIALLQSQVKRKTKQLTKEIAESKTAKNEIRHLNLRQEAILSAVPDIIAEVDINKIYTWVNPAGYRFFGEDVIGKEASFYFEGEQDVYFHVHPIFEGDDNIIYLESWQRRIDGEKRLLGWWCRTLKDDNGNVRGALSTARDITELKKAQQAIVEAKTKLEAVFQSMTDAVFFTDTNAKFVDFNDAFATFNRFKDRAECIKMMGKSEGKIEVFFPDGTITPWNMLAAPRALRGETTANVEYKLRRKDTGETWWGSFSSSPIKDKENRIVGAVVVAHDITEHKNSEKAIVEAKRKLEAVFQSMTDAVLIADTKGRFLDFNDAFATYHRFLNKEDCFEKKDRFRDYIELFNLDGTAVPPDTGPVLRALQGETGNGVEYKTLRKDTGETWWSSVSFNPVKDEGNNIVGAVVVSHDITNRKKADEDLKESQEKFYRAFNFSPVGMAITYYDTQRFVEVNQKWAETLEYTPAEILGRTTAELNIYPDPNVRTAIWQTLYKEGSIQNFEVIYQTKTGKIVLTLISAEIVTLKGEKYLISTMLDITERRKTEKALIESEEKLRRIFETVPEGILLINTEGIILDANQAVIKMHGYTGRSKVISKNGHDLIATKDLEKGRQLFKDTLEKGIMQNVRLTLLRIDGSEFAGEVSGAVIKDLQNNPVGIVIVTSDITARIAAQEEHQKVVEYRELDRVKTNLLSTISHELRTPLASIKGYSSMLLMYDRKLNKMQKNESIEAIDRSTDRLTELIDHLLDMSRLDAGILKLTLSPVNPQQILTAAVDEAKLRSPHFRFKNEIKGKLPGIMADARRLRQVIDNILENAIKYSPENTLITVKTEVKQDEMLVSITDQGRGIPEGEYQKIFERMYRIEQRLQKDPGGLGLGLSLCKALVEGHGGRIWVESVVDKGSTFYFTIPTGKVGKGNKNGDKKQVKIKESTRH